MADKNAVGGDKPFHLLENLMDQVVIPEDGILSQTIYEDSRMRAILFGFSPGQELSEHTAAIPATVQILTGEVELVLGDKTYKVSAGTWAHMEANLPHSVRAHTPTLMLLTMFKS